MALTWKSFDFFEASQVEITDERVRALFDSNAISSVCSGSGSLFLGSRDGQVHIIASNWKMVRSFEAYESGVVTHMHQVEGTSFLVTVAEECGTGESGNEPVLKVWALDKPGKKTNKPSCLSTATVNNGRKPDPITAFAATEDLNQVAIGFANGAVTVLRGDLIHDRGTKQRIVHESREPITGVELHVQPDSGLTTLFMATTCRILKLTVTGRGQGQAPKTVEENGCGVGCMRSDKKTGEIVVARDDAIYSYSLHARGPPSAYDVPKKLMAVYGDYIAIVSPPSSGSGADKIKQRFFSAAQTIYTFTLLDTELKMMVHTESVLSDVRHLFQAWGDLFTVTVEGKVSRYHEKTLQQRLEMLYQRNLYMLAVELAQKSGLGSKQVKVIFRKYGDHLYQKGNYDDAMKQYIKAIECTEPSQVIRKFLDTQRIHNLIEYVEELHEHHQATSDHTTLLLNCYAKLKDVEKLEKFIKSPDDLKFDLETAISMCRQGGYYDQAAFLAKKHGEHELVVDILMEDSHAYKDALDFISHLEPEVAYACLMKYARVLIEHCPEEATQILIDYYTGKYRPRKGRKHMPTAVEEVVMAPEGFAAGAANAVQNLTSLLPLPYMNPSAVTSAATQLTTKATVGGETGVVESEEGRAAAYRPPPPRTAFSSFIDHTDEFIVFLEACVGEKRVSESDKADLYTALFEMYLYKSKEKKGEEEGEEWEEKAKALLMQGKEAGKLPIEKSNVLLLSHLAEFRDGTTLVKELSGLLFDIFRSYTSVQDTGGAIKALRKYGPEEPQLYPAALAYLTSDRRVLEAAGPDELAAVLTRIDRDNLMAPLQVVQTLGKKAVATMGMIKPYLAGRIERERKELASHRRDEAQFRSETAQRRAEMADLGTKQVVFQATRCAQCAQTLELPVVHFLCKHSFHQRCLRGDDGDGAPEDCPKCAMDNATIRALRKGQEENATRHELFEYDLARSEDRFRTVSEWFGKGVMSSGRVPSVE